MAKKVDYRKDLEKAARQMVLVRRLDTLIKLVLRVIIQKLCLEHAVLILYDRQKKEYVARISKGSGGVKVPSGFTKITQKNPLVKYFTKDKEKKLGKDYLLLEPIKQFLASREAGKNRKLANKAREIIFQFSLYDARACVPGLFRNELIYLLFLGAKKRKKSYSREELGFLSVLSLDIVMAIQNAWYFQDLNNQLKANKKLFLQTALALASAIEAKDRYTSGHTERVAQYSLLIAKKIKQIKPKLVKRWGSFFEDLRIASLLHDVGKIGVPEAILNKKGSLSASQKEKMEKHSLIGYNILSRVDQFGRPLMGVKYHHEYYDGQGYPEGIKGEKIPLIAQIIAVADTFDALITDRPYRGRFEKSKAAEIIKNGSGRQFSPLAVTAFLSIAKSEI